MKLILVRHGQTNWNTQHRAQGRTDIPLDETGKKQALLLAEALKNKHIDAIISSPLSRAYDTAKAVGDTAGLQVETDELLTELRFGEWEGMNFDEIGEKYPEQLAEWRQHPYFCHVPGAETPQQVLDRMLVFYDKLKQAHADDTVVIVSHTLPLKVMITHLVGIPYDNMHVLRLDNTGYTQIDIRADGKTTLECANNTTHLEGGSFIWRTLR